MKTLRYDAREPNQLREGGELVPAGGTFTVSDERAAELLTHPRLPISEVADDLEQLTRPQLDELARKAGLKPGSYRNKPALAAAIKEAEVEQAVAATSEPEAVTGEGPNDDQEDSHVTTE